MLEQIIEQLEAIERTENVCILHAVESGSRAWGFASPDSDYDVRFIYVRRTEDYLRLGKSRDVIEWQLDEILDINGWDLQKALRLLHNSNPTLFEWSNSPIVYKTTEYWNALQQEMGNYFSVNASLYHYLNTARSNYREHLKGETVKLKKYFYVIRPLLACQWVLDNGCPPPMLFSELIESELIPTLRPIIDDLMKIKINSPEIAEGERIDLLNDYIEDAISRLEETSKSLPHHEKPNWQRLNKLFLEALS